MKRISITAIVCMAIWSSFVIMGYQDMQGVVAQHIQGCPNAGQIRFYIGFPSMVAVAAALTGLCFWFGRFEVLARIVQALSFVVLFPYLLLYTGGM